MNKIYIHIFIIAYSLLSIGLIYLSDDAVSILWVTGLLVIVLIFIRVAQDKAIPLNFFYVFLLAFFYFFIRELWALTHVSPSINVLLGAKLLSASSLIILSILSLTPRSLRQNRSYDQADVNISKGQMAFIWIALPFYIAMSLPGAIETFFLGRVEAHENSNLGYLRFLLSSLSYLLPAMLAILYKAKRIAVFPLLVCLGVIFTIQIMSGTRFVLLFSLFICASFLLNIKELKITQGLTILFVLLIVSGMTRGLRGGGDGDLDVLASLQRHEQILYYLGGLSSYHELYDHPYFPKYSAFVTYFYIPRVIWESKPELIGHWLLEAGVFRTSYGSGHSGSVSWVGPFFSDFGYLCFSAIYLLAISLLPRIEKLFFKYVGSISNQGIIAASMIPTIFFAFRSLNTSLITFIFVALTSYIFFKLERVTW